MKKHLSMLMLLAALIVPWVTQAQTLASYGFTTGVDSTKWIDMTGSTQILTPSNSDGMASSVVNIGFSFPFGAQTYTQYSVNTDGNLRLGSTVTGTTNYSTPFNSTNANSNNPKINAFGCDGYGVSGSHYVKALNTTDDNGDTLLAVEYCMGTYSSNTRDYLYKWQVHLYANGNIDIVFPSATGLPSTAPAVAHQCGICASSSDGWVISSSTNTAQHFTSGSTVTNSSGTWFDANRYYSFVHPNNISCPAPTGLTVSNITTDGATLSWTAGGSESEWELAVGDDIYTTTTNSYTVANLEGNTPYVASVRAICGAGDTSFAFSTSFRTACVAISQMPYVNDFENEPSYSTVAYADAFPACWHRINDATGTSNYYPYIYASSSYAHSGGVGMYWYHSTTTSYANNEYAVLPPVDLDIYTMSDLTLAFYAKTTSASYHPQPIVGVMTDPTDATTFTPIYTFTATEITTSWELFHVSLASYTGSGAYIAIKWPRTSSTCYLAIDDIFLTDEWCDAPTDVMASSGVDEVTISWNANGGSSFTVFVGTDTVTGVTDTFYTVTGLTPNTLYSYGVARECSDGNSMFINGTIYTQCVALTTLPYTQDFENAATGSATSDVFVNCMTRLNNGSQYFGYPYVSATSSYNHTTNGTRGLYWLSSSTTGTYGDYQCVVLPAVDTDIYAINTLQLRFWARATSTSYNPIFQVGVMSNPNDINSFQLVQTVNVGANTTYSEFTVALGNFEGYGQYVAIKAVRPTSSWYATVDDITLELMPTCPPIADIEVSTTTGSALLSWGYQQGYGEPAGFVLTYDSIGGTNPTVVNLTDPTAMLTGLHAATAYKAYLQVDCGDEYGAADSIEFNTMAFDCLEMDPTSLDTVLFSNSTAGQSGCLAYSAYGNTVYQTIYTAAELTAAGLEPGPITGIDLGFTGCTSYNKEFTIFIGNTATTSISTSTMEDPNQQTLVYGPALHPMNTSGWQHYNFSTPFSWDGVSSIIITTFMNQSGGSQTNSTGLTGYYVSASNRARYHYRDSSPFTLTDYNSGTAASTYNYRAAIHFYVGECMSSAICAAPAVTVSEVDATSATLTWVPGYDETSWDVDYRIVGASTWTNVATGVTDLHYTVDSLQSGTEYEFRVSFVCSDANNTVYASTVTAFTPCLPVALPYVENFDNVTTSTSTTNYGLLPNCWDYTMTGSSSYQASTYWPRVYYSTSTNYIHSGSYCLYLYGVGIFELPEMPTTVDSLMISFYDYTSSASYGLIIGAIEDGIFVPIDTAQLAVSTPNFVEINLNSYTGTSRRLALRNYYTTSTSTYYSYHYIDNLYVDYIPSCPRVVDLVVDSASVNNVTLSWRAGGEETEWSVTGSNGYYATTTVPHITISGLAANSPYTFEVRALCSVDDSSNVRSILARTGCEPYMVLPYAENFEDITNSTTAVTGVPVPCWSEFITGTSSTAAYHPQLYYYTPTGTYSHSGNYSLRLYGIGYTVLPQLPIDANQVSMSFWSRHTTATYELIVGVMTDPTDASTFDTVQTISYTGTTAPEFFEIDFSSYTGTGRYIAFRNWHTSYQYSYHYIDDIEVWRNSTCATPASLLTTNVSNTSATVGWVDTSNTYAGASIFWGTSPNRSYVTDSATVTGGNSYNMTGLISNTTYYVWIQGECVAEPSRAVMISFTTTADCMPVENLAVTSVGNHAFALSWDAPAAGNAPTGYVVRWNESGYDSVYTDTTTNTYIFISGLNASTNYTYSVSTLCNNLVVEGEPHYLTTSLCTEETVGAYATNFSALPVTPTQAYSYSQQIYLASELEGIDSISAIAFFNNGYDYDRRDVTVYLGNTSKDMFTSGSDYVPYANLTQVYNGPYEGFDWFTMHFTQTFVRDVDSNLVVVVDDNTGTAQIANAYFASSNLGDSTRAIYSYGTGNINPASPTAGTASGYRNHVIFTPADCVMPDCDAPVLLVTTTTDTSIAVQWSVEAGATYVVEYRKLVDADWTTFESNNTTGTSNINTLTPSEEWEIRVSFDCNGVTLIGNAVASTLCGAAALPLVEDFEMRDFGDFVRPCWLTGQTRFNGTDVYPRITRLTGSEDRLFFLYHGAYLVMPKVNAPLNELQINFKLTQGGTGARLLMGVIADQALPITSMVVLDTLVRSNIDPTTSTVNIAYSFADMDTAYNNYHIAFYDAFSDNYSFLNDIYLDYIPSCQPPDSISLDTVTTTTATISWNDDGENATNYYVIYGPRGFVPNSGDGDTVDVNAATATLTGLSHSTDYDAYVFTVCSVVNAQSVASQVLQFTTECDVVTTLPYTADFDHVLPPGNTSADMVPNCWISALVSGTARPKVYYTTESGYTGSGNYCLNFTGLGLAALPAMAAPLNTLAVSFRDYNPTPGSFGLIVGTVGDTTGGFAAAFEPYDTIVFDVNTTTYNKTVYFSDYTGTNSRIAFKNVAVSGTTSTHYVDNVVVNLLPTCIPPQNVHTTYLVGDEAKIVWSRSNSASYTVVYNQHGNSTATTLNTSTRDVTLYGLTPQTQYDVKVVGDCGDTVFYSFTTPCSSVTLPYEENFDSYTTSTTAATGVYVNCWGFVPTGTATYQTGSYLPQIYYSSTYATSGNYSYRLYGRGYHTLPPMPTSLDSLQIVFNNYSTSTSYLLEVGVMEGNSFIPIQAIAPTSSTHTEYTINFSSYHGDSRTIAFHNYYTTATTYYSYQYIDDIEVDYIPTCPKIVNLQSTDISDNSVTLAWNTTGPEDEWMISFNATDTIVFDSVATIYGLLPDSTYTFAVRPVCGANDTGRARYITVHTTCSAVTLPYQENFDNVTTSTSTTNYGLVPSCWNYTMTGTASYQTGSYLPRVYYSSTYANSGNYSYYMYGVGYHMLPPMPTSLDSLELTFSRYFTSTSYSLEVGVMEGNTFVPVETIINGSTSTHTDHTVYFGTYTGTSRIIAFRNYYTTSATTYYSGNYIDDIDVHYLPTCPRVLDVHATGSSMTSITVDWLDQVPTTQWQMEYGAMGHTFGSGTLVNVSSHPYTVSGLDTLTNYDFYVRPICSAGDTGDWSIKAVLSTAMCDDATEFYTGTPTGTNNQGPVNNFYRHTLTETIIDSAELVGVGEISYIGYSYNYATAMTDKINVKIWLQPTTKTEFASNTDAVAVNPATAVKVYQGSLNCVQGWNYFALDTNYVWDGHSNLLVIVQDNSGEYDGSGYVFDITATTDYKYLIYYRDGTAGVDTISAYNPSTFTASTAYRYQRRPTMKLVSCGGCSSPAIASVTHTYNSAIVTASGNGSDFELSYGTDPSSLGNTMTSATGVFNITGLTPETQYFFSVRQECDTNVWSLPTEGFFTTDSLPCFPVTGLDVASTSYESVTLTWNRGGNETAWEVMVYNTLDTFTYTASDTTYEATGLTSGVTYNANVRPLCGTNNDFQGEWSASPVNFTTDICQPVTNVAVGEVTSSTATISWTAPAEGSGSYRIEYGYTGFDRGQGQSATATGTTYTIEGLESQVTYDVYVANICTESLVSVWSDVTTFETASDQGIADVDAEGNLSIYPNPASSMVTVSVSEMLAGAEVAIVDLNGRTVMTFTLNGTSGTFDVSKLGQGAYFVRLTGEQATTVRKLIVK